MGTYVVTVNGATSPNYNITFTNGTLVVTKADLVITADDKSKRFISQNPTLTASVEGLANSDTLQSLSGTLKITTTAGLLSLPGSYAITPSGVTSPNYNITFENGTLTILTFAQYYADDDDVTNGGGHYKWHVNAAWFISRWMDTSTSTSQLLHIPKHRQPTNH